MRYITKILFITLQYKSYLRLKSLVCESISIYLRLKSLD